MNTSSSKGTLKIFIPVFTLALILASLLYYRSDGDVQSTLADPADTDLTVPVRVTRAESDIRSYSQTYPGNIEQWEYAFITGMTGSRIDRLHVREGDRVRKGDLMAEMERTQIHQARVQMNTAENEVRRLTNLAEVGAVSTQQLEHAQAQLDNARSQYEQLEKNTYLKAPIDGVVTNRFFVEGEIFAPGGERPAIFTLMTLDPVKVTIHISERFYPQIRPGMEVDVRTDTYPGRSFTGRVHYLSPTVDPRSRTFKVEIRIDNRDRLLSPGMFARVTLDLTRREGIFLPSASVYRTPGNDIRYVYRVDDDRTERVEVTVGERFEEVLQILAGIEDGDMVVTEGAGRIRENSRIQIIE